jgi:hypothetical protein
VQVVQVDLVDAEATGAQEGTLPQVLAVTHHAEVRVVRTTSDEPALGRDDQAGGVRMQGVVDENLVGVRSIRVGRVDEGGSGFNDPPEQDDARLAVGKLARHPGAGQPHRAVAEPVRGEFDCASHPRLPIGHGRR